MDTLTRGTLLELEIESLAFGGRGVARTDEGLVVFVEDALPGQRVRARIVRVKKGHAEAKLSEIVRESPDAVTPRCRHFGTCGGCRLQHLDYPAQLAAKTAQVSDSLRRLGGFRDPEVRDALASPDVYGYRNKMEYSFGDRRWLTAGEMAAGRSHPEDDRALGLHPRGRWNRILHLEECHLPDELSVKVLRHVQEAVARSSLDVFTTRTHKGFWRFLVVREGRRTGQWLVDIITSEEKDGWGEVDELAAGLVRTFPGLTTVTHTLSRSRAAIASGHRTRILHGEGWIEEEISGLSFRISPRAFFQTNTAGAERLYEEARRQAGLQGKERVYDVYCGTGTIALIMAAEAAEVTGIEMEPAAVVDARANAERNAVSNARFVEGDAAALLRGGPAWGPPDVLVFDPPRAGLHPDLRAVAPELGAERIVYISCNPATLARDLAEICGNGYLLNVVQPVDMFPHTPHIECATLLTRR
ncbi:23S rRNA (uracil(1939)-C(5))-methyltransferase RlmD [Gemmatimonadota bacterium]